MSAWRWGVRSIAVPPTTAPMIIVPLVGVPLVGVPGGSQRL